MDLEVLRPDHHYFFAALFFATTLTLFLIMQVSCASAPPPSPAPPCPEPKPIVTSTTTPPAPFPTWQEAFDWALTRSERFEEAFWHEHTELGLQDRRLEVATSTLGSEEVAGVDDRPSWMVFVLGGIAALGGGFALGLWAGQKPE